MDLWGRILRYAWPYRARFFASLLFGAAVALLWSAELLLTFPVVKVFLQGQSLGEYVRHEIDAAERDLAHFETKLTRIDARLVEIPETGERRLQLERVELLNDRARAQRASNAASWHRWWMTWAETRVLPRLPKDSFELLLLLFCVLAVVTLAKGAFSVVQDVLAGSIAERTVVDLRKALFRKTLDLDAQTIALSGTPKLLSRFTYDLQTLGYGLSELGGRVVREPLKGIGCLVSAMLVSWQLTTLSLLLLPVAGMLLYRIGRQMKRATQRVLDSMSRIYKHLEESFDNAQVVIAFNLAGRQRRLFRQLNRDFYGKAVKIVRIDAIAAPVTEFVGLLAVLAAVLPGAYLVLRSQESLWGLRLTDRPMDIAELAVLYTLLAGILDPLRKLSKFVTIFKQSSVAAERVFEHLDEVSRTPDPRQAQLWPGLARELEFRGVRFAYAREDRSDTPPRPSLENVQLTVRAGEVVALVGPNGCGKSTLLGLAARFFDPDEGSILVDGVDLRDLKIKDLRSHLGWVSQETVLFEGTIEDNIRWGRPMASAEEVRAAAQMAHVLEFVDELPQGLKTPVGRFGRELSGGQRQRVGLARAILRNPSLILLDEPTSAIDAQSEEMIHDALARFLPGRTSLLVTHSLNERLLKVVDRIVVMDRSQVVAVGRHEDLLVACPLYRHLFGHAWQRAA